MLNLFESLLFSVHGGGEGDGLIGLLNSFLAILENLATLPVKDIFPAILPGISAMQNIHPLFVHYPIALLSVFFLVDLAGSLAKKSNWRSVASWLLYLGSIFAGLTMIAGLIAADTVPHSEAVHEIMENHEHLGISIFLLSAILSVWRLIAKTAMQGATNYLYLFFGGLLCLLLVFAADLGGLMVYKHGVAVAANAGQIENNHEHNHEHGAAHEHHHDE